jgi:hypothetical protein
VRQREKAKRSLFVAMRNAYLKVKTS